MPTRQPRILLAVVVLAVAAACDGGTVPGPLTVGSVDPSAVPSDGTADGASMVIVGRIVTMADPPIAEALLIEDGLVAAVGSRDEVLARAGDEVPVIDLGTDVAYPGFIDAHAHWIGDRGYAGIDTAAAAIDAAASHGWTSISEQWVNQERLAELTRLAADGALPLRVDAYLALNFDREFFGDWYLDREPGPVDEHLRVKGLKIHLDTGWGTTVLWEPADLTAAIARADAAGWQVSVHTVSADAADLVLDAFEAAIGPTGPNPLHHRIEHAIQVRDDQLERLVAMDLAVVIHPDGATDWALDEEFFTNVEEHEGDDVSWLTRWRDFVDAGLHVAAATDTPWLVPDMQVTPDNSRPTDQIASGMDGRGRRATETPAWIASQALTAEQGLRAVTLDAAWALGDEGRRGHLAPGTVGDVTVLSGDVTDATPDEIRAMAIVATIVGGVPAHCADRPWCAGSASP